ncbi:DoxX family protein [Flavobacterium sp. GT3R68]|uniref:DoxX family protein n=1 Tax=Flavobacterium sp. GT3R68 TaxID=2594437 RepID=UPI000F88D11C|nr:DoxX family protein [Flavobacterium sp. GT3R68]RTY94918.1 DoxX family protein [Flavobacterium sp. GSN2]TRW91722.1 DoxX family protein [Flavobacterium sp. GT3R68]
MKKFPFITLNNALVLLRVVVAILFIAHAVVHISNGTINQFAGFLAEKGFIMSTATVWAITLFEIMGGLTMLLGYFTKWIALGFILMLLIGIAIIHAQLGWFVGEHGTGGMEYSVALIFALIVIAAADNKEID